MKKITAIFLAFALILALSGCTGKETKNYDADVVADALNSGLVFSEYLEKSTADAAYSIYGIDSALCTNAAIYIGSGATADEIAVFSCIDNESAESVMQAVNSRVDYLKDGYSDYGPDQVPKINSAVISKLADNTVIMCICENPEEVNNIINSVD